MQTKIIPFALALFSSGAVGLTTSEESTLVEEQYNEWQFSECQREATKQYAEVVHECLDA